MPNGGVDNCGTCCFNRANRGKSGHPDFLHEDMEKWRAECFCTIRGVKIGDPFWTYCANHPLFLLTHATGAPGKPEPLGPIYSAHGMANRIPWYGEVEPQEEILPKGDVCGFCRKVSDGTGTTKLSDGSTLDDPGVRLRVPEDDLRFCSSFCYNLWWKRNPPRESAEFAGAKRTL